MLLHLPIVILATLLPVAVTETVPKFDIARECRLEGGSTPDLNRCSRDEAAALERLKTEWAQLVGAEKKTCMGEITIGGFASYVELLTCLEMARDVAGPNTNPENQPAKSGSRPKQAAQTDATVGEAHRH
jgi:hypothetical protein